MSMSKRMHDFSSSAVIKGTRLSTHLPPITNSLTDLPRPSYSPHPQRRPHPPSPNPPHPLSLPSLAPNLVPNPPNNFSPRTPSLAPSFRHDPLRRAQFQKTRRPVWDTWDEIAQCKLVYGLLSGVGVWVVCILMTLPVAGLTAVLVPSLMWITLRCLRMLYQAQGVHCATASTFPPLTPRGTGRAARHTHAPRRPLHAHHAPRRT